MTCEHENIDPKKHWLM